jgi:hypothetical protein
LSSALEIIALNLDFSKLRGLADQGLAALSRGQESAVAREPLKAEIDDQGRERERGQIGRKARDQDESPRTMRDRR